MNRTISVVAVQLEAHDRRDFHDAFDGILDAVSRASRGAELLVLPEGTIPGYVLGREPLEAEEIDGAIAALARIARKNRTVIVVGAAFAHNGEVRNGAVVIDADGSLAGRADKLFLWHFDRRWFACGDRVEPIPTGVGSLGILVCADGRLPTIARALVDGGAELLVMPTAWVTSGRDPHALENVQADLLARVRAYENRVPFVAANKCGSELGMVAYCGKSQIVDASGELLAIAGQREAEMLCAPVTLGAVRPQRATLSGLQPRARGAAHTLRIAISFDSLAADIDQRLELLDDDYALAPGDRERFAMLDRTVALAEALDETVLDPAGLVAYRRAGYELVCWTSDLQQPWLERIARARALELRLYLVVFDRSSQRAFAVDPDGTILAGTFGGYRIASFAFDPRRVRETAVAPGTDVAEGLDRIAALTGVHE